MSAFLRVPAEHRDQEGSVTSSIWRSGALAAPTTPQLLNRGWNDSVSENPPYISKLRLVGDLSLTVSK
jgi:hypothetical protein